MSDSGRIFSPETPLSRPNLAGVADEASASVLLDLHERGLAATGRPPSIERIDREGGGALIAETANILVFYSNGVGGESVLLWVERSRIGARFHSRALQAQADQLGRFLPAPTYALGTDWQLRTDGLDLTAYCETLVLPNLALSPSRTAIEFFRRFPPIKKRQQAGKHGDDQNTTLALKPLGHQSNEGPR